MNARDGERDPQPLRLFRVSVPCVDVSVRGRHAGRYFRLGRHRGLVSVDAATGSVDTRCDDRDALAHLSAGREPVLGRATVEVLAVCVLVEGHEQRPLTVAYVLDVGTGGNVVVDMAGVPSLHLSEADAVRSVVPEALWRAGVLKGAYPDMPADMWDSVDGALVRLLVDA